MSSSKISCGSVVLDARGCPRRPTLFAQTWTLFTFKKKRSAVSTTDGWLKLNFASCVKRQTRSLGALVLYSIIWSLWIKSTIWLLMLNPKVLWYAVRACSICIPHERYKSVTPLGATRVIRTILQGRCGPWPFCARILYDPHRGRGKIYAWYCYYMLNRIKQNWAKNVIHRIR